MKSFYLLLLLQLPFFSYAQWNTDPSVNNKITRYTGGQYYPGSVVDSDGSIFIAWWQQYSDENGLRVQKISKSGLIEWDSAGVSVAADGNVRPQLITDGNGGIIVAWQAYRDGNEKIYAQRLDASGNSQWATSGVAVSADSNQHTPVITTDNNQGCIIAWQQTNDEGLEQHIYVQRLDSSGALQWGTSGKIICNAAGSRNDPYVKDDGGGGCFVAWSDYRLPPVTKVYAQRLNADGEPQWAANGIKIDSAVTTTHSPLIAKDLDSGIVICYYRFFATAPNAAVFAQRINRGGDLLWGTEGKALGPAAISLAYTNYKAIASDSAGGIVAVWQDQRGGTSNTDIYLQHINGLGELSFDTSGLAVCTEPNMQYEPRVAYGDGRIGVVWLDSRTGIGYRLYGQVLSLDGTPYLQEGGDTVSLAITCLDPAIVYSDGGFVSIWRDKRWLEGWDQLFASKMMPDDTPLPLSSLILTGKWAGEKAALQWRCESATPMAGFIVQRSGDGKNYQDLDFVRVNEAGMQHYAYADAQVTFASPELYYRLKAIAQNGTQSFSNIAVLKTGIVPRLQVFPNPARDHLTIETAPGDKYRIADATGKVCIQATASGNITNIDVSKLAAGIYQVTVESGYNLLKSIKITISK